MTPLTNEAIVRSLMDEVWQQGRLDRLADLIAVDYVGHFAIGDHYGPEGARIDVAAYRTAIPDLSVRVDELTAIRDTVVRRFVLRGTLVHAFLGIPADGNPVVLKALGIDRLAGGKLVESWVHVDGAGAYGTERER